MVRQFIQYAVVMAYLVCSVNTIASWRDKLLYAENQKRELHNVPPLRYSDWLSDGAQKWAEHLAVECDTHKHSHTPKDPVAHPDLFKDGMPAGENIYKGWAPGSKDIQMTAEDSNPAERWYGEIENYNFEDASSKGGSTGHFTQMVWKNSQEVGYGLSTCNGVNWFIVARYFPPGNVGGGYEENVFPPA